MTLGELSSAIFGATSAAPTLRLTDQTGAAVLYVRDGKVGIGTTAPAYKLDVRGNLAVHMAQTDAGLLFGDNDPVNEKWHIGY